MCKTNLERLVENTETALTEAGASAYHLRTFKKVTNHLIRYAKEKDQTEFSLDFGIEFLEDFYEMREKMEKHKFRIINLYCINEMDDYQKKGAVSVRYGTIPRDYAIPVSFRSSYDSYLEYRTSVGIHPKTLVGDKLYLERFLNYLDKNGVNTLEDISLDHVLEYTVARDMHLSLPVIFRILYGCGMRVSEVCGLRRSDVDTKNGILTIRDSKNGSDRIVPLSSSVHQSLLKYTDAVSWKTDDEFFFRAPDRSQIAPITLYQRYRSYLFQAGISHGGKGKGPRLHDLRHTFAVHALQKWIAEGSDLLAKLPALSVYMGHRNAQSTAKYLRLTAEVYPELMEKIENYSAYVIPGVCYDAN